VCESGDPGNIPTPGSTTTAVCCGGPGYVCGPSDGSADYDSACCAGKCMGGNCVCAGPGASCASTPCCGQGVTDWCIGGTCAEASPFACTSNSQCLSGQCTGGVCASSAPNQTCVNQSDCNDGTETPCSWLSSSGTLSTTGPGTCCIGEGDGDQGNSVNCCSGASEAGTCIKGRPNSYCRQSDGNNDCSSPENCVTLPGNNQGFCSCSQAGQIVCPLTCCAPADSCGSNGLCMAN